MRFAGYEVNVRRCDGEHAEENPHSGRLHRLLLAIACAVALLGIAVVAWAYPNAVLWTLRQLHLTPVARAFHVSAFLDHRAATLRLEALTKNAEFGDAKAQYELFESLRDTPDSWKGEQWLKRSAEAGYAEAEAELGNRAGSAGDYAQAVRWYRAAAVQGHGHAKLQLGWAYLQGMTVPVDCWKAEGLFKDAAA